MRIKLKNWLIHKIHDDALLAALQRYARGILVDVGCGVKPYTRLTDGLVTAHIGVDHPGSQHAPTNVDVVATAYETNLASNVADTVLCTVVLEHLERPQDAIIEMQRILKPGGHLILSTPLFWHLHEEPRDFFRYTKYGLEHLFKTAGLEVVEIKPLAGFSVTFGQEVVYWLHRFQRGPLVYPIAALQMLIQAVAYVLNRWDRSYEFTWAYMAVVKKPSGL